MNPQETQNQNVPPAAEQAAPQTAPATSSATASTPAASKNTLMAVLSYIGPLVIIPYLTAKDDAFVKFHIKQGLVLLVIAIAVWFLGMILPMLFPLYMLVNLATFVLMIVGIVHAVQGTEKELPLVGKFGSNFKI